MDVVQMALIRGVYAEQCLNRVHLLDLASELLWVRMFCCATNPTSAIIVLLPTVNLHGSLPAFIPLSICSLAAPVSDLLLLVSNTLPDVVLPNHRTAFAHNPL